VARGIQKPVIIGACRELMVGVRKGVEEEEGQKGKKMVKNATPEI